MPVNEPSIWRVLSDQSTCSPNTFDTEAEAEAMFVQCDAVDPGEWRVVEMVPAESALRDAVARFLSEDEGAEIVHPGTDDENTRLDVPTETWEQLCAALPSSLRTEGA